MLDEDVLQWDPQIRSAGAAGVPEFDFQVVIVATVQNTTTIQP